MATAWDGMVTMEKKMNIFKNANFGQMYKTRCGCKAVYISPDDDDPDTLDDEQPKRHLLYVYNLGINSYYPEGYSFSGIAADDIVVRVKDMMAPYELYGHQMAKITDCLNACKNYIESTRKRTKTENDLRSYLLKDIADCKKLLKL